MTAMSVSATSTQPPPTDTWRELVLPALGVWALFLAFSLIRMPVPAPNEPYYLVKAKHYWDAGFCRGDFFLDSDDTHLVFYLTFGWLTRFLSLAQTALVGRVIALGMLAAGLTAFVSRLVPGRWGSVWTTALFLALAAVGNFSGEWIVGGVEAKVFSYACLFFGLAALLERRLVLAGLGFREGERGRGGEGELQRRLVWAGLWLGLAISFHPVVGVWGLACAVFAEVCRWLTKQAPIDRSDGSEPGGASWKSNVLALVALVAAALPGLIPAFDVVGAAPENIQHQADFIAVFYRLKHHLDPMDFTLWSYVGYAVLLCFWLIVKLRSRPSRTAAWFHWFALGSLLIAFAGLVIGLGPRPAPEMPWYELRMTLMKFYPFRLADVMLPLACAVAVVRLGALTSQRRRMPWLLCAAATIFVLTFPPPRSEANPSGMTPAERTDWQAACAWISQNTPADSRFLTPRETWAFKWFAQRAEYVAMKDCPQDAAGIVEWNRRLRFRSKWLNEHAAGGYSPAALRELREKTGVTHLLIGAEEKVALEPVYSNRHFAVYRLGDVRGAAQRRRRSGS